MVLVEASRSVPHAMAGSTSSATAPALISPASDSCTTAPTLIDLPDHIIVSIAESIVPDHPLRLGALCAAHRSFNAALAVPEADSMWTALCRRYGTSFAGAESAKTRFGRHASTLCQDCHAPTRYVFTLLGCRLCEACERASPHKYSLATMSQLVHEASVVAELSQAQRRQLFSDLPSIELGSHGHAWFMRATVVAAAQRMLAGDAGAEAADAPVEVSDALSCAEARRRAGAMPPASSAALDVPAPGRDHEADEEEDDDEAGASPAVDASVCEAAEADRAARRTPGQTARAALRDERKAHKRKVKMEQREKRERATVALPASCGTARATPLCHRPKRVSAREHRVARAASGWEADLERLEVIFGDDLCGLSGLALAVD